MVSKIDLINWKLNPNINPKTNRKIKDTGKIYKKLSVSYSKNFNIDISNLDDHVDLISQDRFIEVVNGRRKWVYKNIDDIVFYQEDDHIRAFTKLSLKYLKQHNIKEHPVSCKEIPSYIFKNIKVEENISEDSLENISKIFFQKLSKHSIFINEEKFLNLDFKELKKLEYELKDFYYQNLSDETRIQIDKKDGQVLFKEYPNDVNEYKKYLLENMNKILDNISKEMIIFSYYIIVGALSLVIPEVKEDYPNYSFSF